MFAIEIMLKPRNIGPLWGEPPADYPDKGPVRRKAFSFHDAFINHNHNCWWVHKSQDHIFAGIFATYHHQTSHALCFDMVKAILEIGRTNLYVLCTEISQSQSREAWPSFWYVRSRSPINPSHCNQLEDRANVHVRVPDLQMGHSDLTTSHRQGTRIAGPATMMAAGGHALS